MNSRVIAAFRCDDADAFRSATESITLLVGGREFLLHPSFLPQWRGE